MKVQTKINLALTFGIIGIVTNFLAISIAGTPLSIPLSIMGFAIALTTRDDSGFSKKAKSSLVVCLIAFAGGVIVFYLMLNAFKMLQDPVMSKELTKVIDQMMQEMPEELREQLRLY